MKLPEGLATHGLRTRKRRVLFVCIGNSCRSQMAEGFARAYGSDVMMADSAGLYPATSVADLTGIVMAERNINLSAHFPKGLDDVNLPAYDIIVNMSGQKLPVETRARVLEWEVTDPIGQSKQVYEAVASKIEVLVMELILDLRKQGQRLPRRR